MNDSAEPEVLIAQSDALQLDFLRDELKICHNLVELAASEHETDHNSGFEQALANAEAGYRTIAKFSSNLRNSAHREEIQFSLRELRAVLNSLARR
jgi:hypothetical protein